MIYILYNPLANNGTGEKAAHEQLDKLGLSDVEFRDVTKIDDLGAFVSSLTDSDRIILAGGDGTINKFANSVGDELPCAVDYIPTGSGNDFANDMGIKAGELFRLNDYLKKLPRVNVNGNTYKFINGIGYGIDGYCCEVGDELKKKSDKPVNYAGIAVKGLLFYFKPRNATVIVDGVESKFKKVWLAPSMKGRYYGGGMNVAPEQDRTAADGKLSVVVWHGAGKLTTLMRFPKIFKGLHVKYKKMISIQKGSEITVKFDKPTALQIDGETVLGVTEYTAIAD